MSLTRRITVLLPRLLALLIFFGTFARAQTYPVQAFVQISPPFTSYLPEYADPMNSQMKVLLTLSDFTVPSYQVKLRFKFEGTGYSITNEELLLLPSFTLTPGVPLEVSGSDLAPYLATSNLVFSGIDVSDYELRKVLPEGPCTICVEVIDFSGPNQSVLSNESCTQVWFSLNDPPLLNSPFCGTEITPTDPQNVFFNWTPIGLSTPYSAFGTEYTFELFEIRPDGADPNMVVNSSLPIYIETTTNTFINYGIMQPPLQVGMSYVWRVRAKELSGKDIYRNNGYSEVCTFTYGSIAGSLLDGLTIELKSQGTGVRQGLAWWNGSAVFSDYLLEVRKTGSDSYSWFPYPTDQTTLKVNSLEPETEYECRVKGLLGDEETDWSNTSVFTTQPQPNYACGSTALPARVPDIVPLISATKGMYFTVGQFEMQVTSLEALSSPGHYKGFGKISVPFALINLKVKFDDILVDENHFVRSGSVQALTKGMDEWLDEMTDKPFQVPGIIDGWEFNGDSSVTVTFGDEEVTYDFPESGSIVVEDESGLIYTFNSDGTYSIDGGITVSDDHLAARENYQVQFKASPDQQYGFDKLEHLQWQKNYEAILLSDSTYYFTPYKSIAPGETDEVLATVISDEPISSLIFNTLEGESIEATKTDSYNYKLSLSGLSKSTYIYVFDDAGAKIGKLWVKVYSDKAKDVVIVPVNGAAVPTQSEVETELNRIYAQANVSWTVTVSDNFESTSWDKNSDGKLQAADATLMKKYSEEMRALRDAYFESHDKVSKYHLFVVDDFENASLDGYMVRGKALGFVKAGSDEKTYAHELAHGAFALQHTFPTIPQGETDNLLDYSEGDHLTQYQWYEMRNYIPKFSFLDGEEDAALINASTDEILSFYDGIKVFTNVDDQYAFPLMGGTFLKIPGVDNIMFTEFGKVYKFTIGEKVYRPVFARGTISGTYKYKGYFIEPDRDSILHKLPESADRKQVYEDLRFKAFSSVSPTDTIFTKTAKLQFGEFADCYCEAKWQAQEAVDISAYLSSNGQYENSIHNRLDFPEEIEYESCIGSCPDYDEYDVEGPAENLFVALYDDVDSDQRSDLAEMIRHINEQASGKTFVFYTELEETYSNGQKYWYSYDKTEVSPESNTIPFFRDFEIYNLDRFNDFFSVISEGDDVYDIIFSPVDLWAFKADAPHYNAHTIDYTSFPIPHVKDWEPTDPEPLLEVIDAIEELYDYQTGIHSELTSETNFQEMEEFIASVREDPTFWLAHKLQLRMNIIPCFKFLGMFELYEYDLSDLIARRVAMRGESSAMKNAITHAEANGQAVPLSLENDYSQYVNKYDTDCAFYLGFEYMKMYTEEIFEPAVLAVLISRAQKVISSYKGFKPSRDVDDIFRKNSAADNIGDDLDDLFANAREKAIAKYGEDAEHLIYVKFKDDGGAAAVIMNRFGDEGLAALQKFDDLDDVAGELIKGKKMYRHIGGNVTYLNSLKSSGKIPSGFDTYITLDKFDNPIEAASKMQLPPENDAVWRLEFQGTQLENSVIFPTGKWNNAEYKEVLTRSFPEWGQGGATQFVTKSEIKLDRMVNLETGEIIVF